MLKLISNNWQAKLVCLILAMGFWVYVAVGESQVDYLPGKIPLTIKNIPDNLVAIADVDSVQIKISSDRTTWQRLSANSFESFIDLHGLTQGTYQVDVTVNSNVSKVDIVDINPKKVLVRLEPLTKKTVPVKLQTEGNVGDGLVPGDATIDHEEVEISGAQSIINKVLEATAVIQLNGETSDIEKTVPLVALDSQGEKIKNINFSPGEVKVKLPIVKTGTSKTVGIKVKLDGNPKTGFWVSQITTSPSTITVRGNNGVLKNINYIETKSVNVEGISAEISKTVDLDLPSGVSLADNNLSVKVDVQFSSVSSSKEITAALVYNNLASNLKIDSSDPSTIKVIVSGSTDLLNTLSSDNVKINFDLTNYHTAGSYSIDLNKDIISVPSGATVSSFNPSAIKINLSNK